MQVLNWKDCADVRIEQFPYKGKMHDVEGVTVRWLSQTGMDDSGQPEYGLRLFTVQPKGRIPIHNHFYVQTMYILSGKFECWRFDPETDAMAEKWVCGPGDAVYVPSMLPHGMQNLSETEKATFLCCICNVYEEDSV